MRSDRDFINAVIYSLMLFTRFNICIYRYLFSQRPPSFINEIDFYPSKKVFYRKFNRTQQGKWSFIFNINENMQRWIK